MGGMKEWYKDEKKYMALCIAAIFTGGLGSILYYIFHKVIYPDIMIALGVFLFFLRVKYHFIEPRLYKFYEGYYNFLNPTMKSIDEYLSLTYLNLFLVMCISFFSFTIFLVSFVLFMAVDQFFNISYLKYQKQSKQDWSEGVVNTERLFGSWVIMNYIDILLGIITLTIVFLLTQNIFLYKIVAYSFIGISFLIEIILDFCIINKDFYFHLWPGPNVPPTDNDD